MAADQTAAGFISGDDPRAYRHPSNRNPGQSVSRLSSTANHWLHARIRLEKKGPFTYITPEVYIETGDRTIDPATGVPKATGGEWIRVHNERTGVLEQRRVISAIPFSQGRLTRGIVEIASLFKCRALVPTIVTDENITIPDAAKSWLQHGPAPTNTSGKMTFAADAA